MLLSWIEVLDDNRNEAKASKSRFLAMIISGFCPALYLPPAFCKVLRFPVLKY